MEIPLLGALVGFIAGIAGYIIVKFWILPISQYRKVKLKISADLSFYRGFITKKDKTTDRNKNSERLKEIRRNSVTLSNLYGVDLPEWYKILLRSRKESPDEAAKLLLKLGNIRDQGHAEKRMEETLQHLNIKPED